MIIETELVAGRTCGACNVCCVALTIDEPALRKPQGVRCHNALPDNGCAIYMTRPDTCRDFYCGWRLLRWVRTPRPDLSGVLVRLAVEEPDAKTKAEYTVTFMILNEAALDAEGLAESVAASVAANIPTFMVVPGPPGFMGAEARINDVLIGAVRAKDKAGMLMILRAAWAKGKKGKRVRVVMD